VRPFDRKPLHNLCLAAALATLPMTAQAAQPEALRLLKAAAAAQGGEAQLRSIRSVRWRTQGYRNMVEQSERPEGPYIPEFRTTDEVHDLASGRFRSVAEIAQTDSHFRTGIVADKGAAMRIAGSARGPGNADALASAREALALSPERVLITALDAPDVRLERPEVLQSVPQDVVRFTFDGAPVRLFLNRSTHLPTAVDYSGPLARDGYWRLLGDTTMRTYFSFWWLGERGIRLPLQSDVYRNGLPDTTALASSVAVDKPLPEADMAIPDDIRAKFAVVARAAATPQAPVLQAPVEAAPGVFLIPGAWNVVLVGQADGVVVIEAPISSIYSEQVIARAATLFPEKRIKAVVTTSDAWPHFAGIRPYVGRGIPIYALDLNLPILTRFAAQSFTAAPDALQKSRRKPIFRTVSSQTTIGSGATRIDLYPLRGETSERQMMAYFPALKLLYGSDPFQQVADGSFRSSQAVSELVDAVARERLAPERFMMMHVRVTPWQSLLAALDPAKLRFPGASEP